MASIGHLAKPDVASGLGVTTPDVASGRGVMSSCGVRKPHGITERGVGGPLPLQAQAGAATGQGKKRCHRKRCHVRGSPDVTSKRGVKISRGVMAPHVINDVAS